MPVELANVNWVMIGIFLVVLVVGWTIVRTVLRLTTRVFALGCVGLLVLGGIVTAAAIYLSSSF